MAQYEGVITLQNVNDGAAGRGVSSIETKYYLGASSTQHPSDTSSDWQDSLPALEQGKYLWTQTKVSYTSGNPVYNYSISYVATDGTITTQYYTRIKYAEDNQGTNWSDTPTSTTTYVGFYSGVEQSPAASQYTWSRYVGEKGDKGDTGNNGQSSYTYIRYSEQSDGTGFVSTPTASTKYIGVYSGTSATAPTNKTAYTWSKYIGENGKNGNGITSITYYYKATTENNAPAASQITSTTMPTLTSTNKYLWQKEVIDFTDSTVADKVTVTLLAVYGDTGQAGTSITITNTEIMYVGSTSGTETPSSGWQNIVPSIANGNYLWTRTVVTYSDGSSTTAYSVAYKGTNGEDGNKYYVKSNIDTIKRLFDVANDRVEFLPSQFEFQVFDNDDSSTPLQTSLYNYTAWLILLDSLESYNITTACTVAPQNNPNKVVLSIENLKQKLIELAIDVSLDVDDCQIRLEFSYPKVNGKIVAQQLVIIENGLEADFAKFKVNAANISANIANAGLVFSSEGLSINNGNFTINDENGNPLFIYNETEHKLTVTGNSYFSGQLEAAGGTFSGTLSGVDGDFTGKINANEGLIGGFSISQGQLISTDNNQSIQLNGADGSIIANNIKLGTGAEINNYLKLGNAFIYNPEHSDRNGSRLFISAGNSNSEQGYLKIYDTGNIDLGNIKLQGQNSIINLNSNDAKITAGDNVRITPDRSVFKNVDITGTLHTSVFEVGKVQTAGGAMIFKEGAEINTIVQSGNNYNFTTKTLINLKQNSIVGFVKDNDVIYGVISSAVDQVYTTTTNIIGYTNVVQLADSDGNNNYVNNLIIGINSGESEEKTGLYPQALTMRKITGYSNATVNYDNKPVLVLGQLGNLNINGVNGYGLYGQNVYLTGSLTTEVSQNSYAGINTLNGVPANIFDNITNLTPDNSKIVFWAGANKSQYSTLDLAIQNAPFQVTEQGSFYAGQGYFRGAIITDADIYAAALHTADIYGTGTITSEKKDVLKIHDTNSGIGFYNENDERQLNITNSGLGWGDNNQFIQIANNLINFTGNIFQGEIFKGNFEGNITTEKDINNKYIGFEGSTIQGRQLTDNDSILLGYLMLDTKTILSNNKEKIELDSGAVNITANITSMSKDVYFGNKMKYQQITDENNNIIGYDLYIS